MSGDVVALGRMVTTHSVVLLATMEDMMVAALAVGVLVDAAAIAYFAQLDLDC